MRSFAPQPVARPGRDAARTSPPLVRGCHRDTRGVQPGHTLVRVEQRPTRQTGVDDYSYTRDGQRGFRDWRADHHPAHTCGGRRERGLLLRLTQRTVQRQDGEGSVLTRRRSVPQRGHHPVDLTRAGEETQHVPALHPGRVRQRSSHRAHRRVLQVTKVTPRRPEVDRIDRERLTLAHQQRRRR